MKSVQASFNASQNQPFKKTDNSIYVSYAQKSPEEWKQWWLKRYSFNLASEPELTTGLRQMYWAIVNVFLTQNKGNPRSISIKATTEFINKDSQKHLNPLILFYTKTANSSKHITAINKSVLSGDAEVSGLNHPKQKLVDNNSFQTNKRACCFR